MNDEQISSDVERMLVPGDLRMLGVEGDAPADLDAERGRLSARLADVVDEEGAPVGDPLLAAVLLTRRRARSAEAELRMLLAYAREFAPVKYTMDTLAWSAGMSSSNVRKGKAYDDKDVAAVSRVLGRPMPGRADTSEIAAMRHIDQVFEAMPRVAREAVLADDGDLVTLMPSSMFDLDDAARSRAIAWIRAKYGVAD